MPTTMTRIEPCTTGPVVSSGLPDAGTSSLMRDVTTAPPQCSQGSSMPSTRHTALLHAAQRASTIWKPLSSMNARHRFNTATSANSMSPHPISQADSRTTEMAAPRCPQRSRRSTHSATPWPVVWLNLSVMGIASAESGCGSLTSQNLVGKCCAIPGHQAAAWGACSSPAIAEHRESAAPFRWLEV